MISDRSCADTPRSTTSRRLRLPVGNYRGDKILFATPLLRWYMDHGLEVSHVYQVVEYYPIPCFRRFGDAVSTARREGDVHSHKAIIADTISCWGTRVTERPSPTWTDIVTSTTARRRRRRSWSTIDDSDNSTSSLIDPPSERITWCFGEWQDVYATMDLVDGRFEEGLPSASMLDSSTRNLIVIDYLMAETDERVTNLFTKKVITGTRPCCISYRTCSPKIKRVVPSV